MRWAAEVRERVRGLVFRSREDAEMVEEMRFHLEMEAERLVREEGLGEAEARRRAAVAFGGVEKHKEEVREGRGLGAAEHCIRNLRFAFRRLIRDRGYSLPVVLTLALGTGVVAAVFSLVHGVLLQPLAFPDPGRLVAIGHAAPGIGLPDSRNGLSAGIYRHYRENNEAFEDIGAYVQLVATLASPGEPERIPTALVSPNLLSTLGVAPHLGGLPREAEPGSQGGQGAVISHGLWTRRFGGDPGAVGTVLEMGGRTEQIVGVMPPGFRFPDDETQVWIGWSPEALPGSDRAGVEGLFIASVGRLRPGTSPQQAERDLQRLVAVLPDAFPDVTAERLEEIQLRAAVVPLKDRLVGSLRVPLLLLLAAAGFLLLITGANAVNLTLVRAEHQRREVAVARALGAGGGHLAARFAAESAVIAVLGGLGGLALAGGAVHARFGLEPGQIPRLDEVRIDGNALALLAGLSLGTAVLLALISLLRTRTPHLSRALTGASGRMTAGGSEGGVRKALVAGQVALALVLLVGAGLMVQSYWNLREVELGFAPADAVVFHVPVPTSSYGDYHASARVQSRILEGLRRIPGVTAAESGDISGFPLTPVPSYYQERVLRADGGVRPVEEWPFALVGFATPGYFAAMGIPVLGGRAFLPDDTRGDAPGVVISQSLARELFPDRDAIGGKVRWSAGSPEPDLTVVGVVGDVPSERLRDGPSPVIYLPHLYPPASDPAIGVGHGHTPDSEMYVLRTTLPLEALAPSIRQAVHRVDPELVIAQLGTLQGVVDESTAQARLTMLLLLLAGGTALFLGIVGIYGVLSYAVSQRTPELGVRIALGADPAGVVRMVVRQGAILSAMGIAVGLLFAAALSRFLEGFLYEVSSTDPLSFLGMAALLFAIALGASYMPARRAAATDPARVLRAE